MELVEGQDLAVRIEKGAIPVDAALAAGRAENLMPLTVVVLDSGGRIVAAKSEDGSGLLRFAVAHGKAWGALGMGMSSRDIVAKTGDRPTFQTSLAVAPGGNLVPAAGGVLIRDDEGLAIALHHQNTHDYYGTTGIVAVFIGFQAIT